MKKLLAALGFWLAACLPGHANVPCTVPFNLQNGTTADASQVMANYNALIVCLQSAAVQGVNSDITQLLGLTSPFTPTQGGSPVFLGGTSGGSANAQTIAATTPNNFSATLNYTVIFKAGFTNSGPTTLTVAATAPASIFKQSATGPVALTGNEIQAGQIVSVIYDGTQYEMLAPLNLKAGFGTSVSGGDTISISSAAPPYGFDQPVNMGLTAVQNTPGANLLQVCVTTAAGATPTATNPVLVPFTNNGLVTWLSITAAHCMDTNGAGASVGSQNGVPFRLWVVEFNNGGTPVLALWHSGAGAATTAIAPLMESQKQTTTAISNAATSAGTFYTPNGTTIGGAGANFKILGYLEYSAGLATAGNYGSAPTKIQLFGPGVKKPGDAVQAVFISTSGVTPSLSITPTSTINLVKVSASATGTTGNQAAGSYSMADTIKRGVTSLVSETLQGANGAGGTPFIASFSFPILDNPATASAVAYTHNGTGTFASFTTALILLEEIQG